ncbi:MAG: DedA family protein [Bacteroidota bacterium]|jgi:membrane-associated protein
MELFHFLIDFILHIDDHLGEIIQNYGLWIYAIIFLIVFCETGLVVTPFLPGDSLLFATGAIIAAQPEAGLSFWVMYGIIFVAAVIGDATNYHIGKFIGDGVFKKESKYIKKEYLDKTRIFYEKHGGKAIVYARFVPIIRTFAPFVAGVGTMEYKRFFFYNVFGAFLWVTLFLGAGFLFGNLDFIKNNFSVVILTIIFVSLMPILIEFIKARRQS